MVTQKFGGEWTRKKLEILSLYLDAYTTALKNQPFFLTYIDAFAGPGNWQPGSEYIPEEYGEFNKMLEGSPKIALEISDKPFDGLVFIEQNPEHAESLESIKATYPNRNVSIVNEDANIVLPQICRGLRPLERAVVFLDPYATQVSWSTIECIAATEKIDCWILFPLMAITRQMPVAREPDQAWMLNLDRIFGGREYWHELYAPATQQMLFGPNDEMERSRGSDQIAEAYRRRLTTVFSNVAPTRRVLKNSTNSNLFDLFFAASNPRGAATAVKIADHILKHW